MRFKRIILPEKELMDNGLKTIDLKRLKDINIITGKNGAGKTRLLKKIQLGFNIFKTKFININGKKPVFEEIKSLEKILEENKFQKYVLKFFEFDENYVPENYKNISCVDFVPKSPELIDPHDVSPNQSREYSNQIVNLGFKHSKNSSLAKIQNVQDRFFNATHQNFSGTHEEIQIAKFEYENLQNLILEFFGENLGRSIDGKTTLFNMPLGKASLSDGQKILFQLITALHYQTSSLDGVILLMDEPENHLHPSVIIEVIERLRKNLKNGQIFISTHSLPIIANLAPENLWFMDQGQISYAGRIPEKVLEGLLGSKNGIDNMANFLNLHAINSANKFSLECLIQPKPLETSKNDQQIHLIYESLKSLKKFNKRFNKKIRILDFGAGEGRFVLNMYENSISSKDFDYYAYEINQNYSHKCKENISLFHCKDNENRFISDKEQLLHNFKNKKFDLIIMTNVFHEISPENWMELFSENGLINNVLNEKGFLMIVEDHILPIGEKAHEYGFLVFDTEEFEILFNTKKENLIIQQSIEEKYIERLKAHLIPRNIISTNLKSINNSIKHLNTKALNKIEDIRTNKTTGFNGGKKLGFWMFQFTNSYMYLNKKTGE